MMGERRVQQDALFYEFSLERHVPETHLLRAIDRFVDLDGVRGHLAPFYSETGRPSIDPELMIRMLIVGYCFGIRSERRLCEEVHLNLGYRQLRSSWPLGWGAPGRVQASLRARRVANVGGQDGLRRIERPSFVTQSADIGRLSQPTMRTHPTLAPVRALLSALTAEPVKRSLFGAR